jgi:hypothetical protein
VTVSDSSNTLAPGSATFDLIAPKPAIMLNAPGLQSTTP